MSIIKLEIEQTPENCLAVSAMFAILAGDDSAKKLAHKAKTAGKPPENNTSDNVAEPAKADKDKQEDDHDRKKHKTPEPEQPESEQPNNAAAAFGGQPEPEQPNNAAAAFGGQTENQADNASVPSTVDLSAGLDGTGMPWDSRIHGSGKTKLAKKPNPWKLIRGVDKDLVASVLEELEETDWEAIVADSQPADQSLDQSSDQPADQPATGGTVDQATFTKVLIEAMGSGHEFNGKPLTQPAAMEVLQRHGLQNITQVAADPAAGYAALKEMGLNPNG